MSVGAQAVLRTIGLTVLISAATLAGLARTSGGDSSSASAAALPTITITIAAPADGASYERGSRVPARFRCSEGGATSAVLTCEGTRAPGQLLDTRSDGARSFTVTATDGSGNTVTRTVKYTVWAYVDPIRAVSNLQASRVDMGVDYAGAGPIGALGRAKVVLATDRLAGPESCWGRTCVPPPGDMIVYRLLDGPFAGKYVYVVEHITIRVRAGQTVKPGETIAILHEGSPNLELGWASGHGAQTLADADGHKCSCADPGGWSSIEGRNFNHLLVGLGAPSGYVTTAPPGQRMPRGWPGLPAICPTPQRRDGCSG